MHLEYPHKHCILVGDLNSRFAGSVKNLQAVTEGRIKYEKSNDNATHPNSNALNLIQSCNDTSLVVLNNSKTKEKHFQGSCTFRQKDRWISELDICLLTEKTLPYVNELHFNTSTSLPSNHAPMTVSIASKLFVPSAAQILRQVEALIADNQYRVQIQKCNKAISFKEINVPSMLTDLNTKGTPLLEDKETSSLELERLLYESLTENKLEPEQNRFPMDKPRWESIIETKDSKTLWSAIGWRGEMTHTTKNSPDTEAFKAHFEELLNPADVEPISPDNYNSNVYIPCLDDPITPAEVQHVVNKQLKPGKACGPDGIPGDIYKTLPAIWLIWLTQLMNVVFYTGYPLKWAHSKFTTILKKGNPLDCNNYRGISCMDSIAKVYDYIVTNRLQNWFTPNREQAGNQTGRGCLEHILTLRLLLDYALCKRKKLFVTFIDFSKAYDRASRSAILETLIKLGVGSYMLSALVSMNQVTYAILGTAIITARLGVRQGAPSSGFLFTMLTNNFVQAVKTCNNDGYLQWLHTLLMMDDTIILATTREQLKIKLQHLKSFCESSGMYLNEDKSKFFVINGNQSDKEPIQMVINNKPTEIKECLEYCYLGADITADGRVRTAVLKHAQQKAKHLNKFLMFMSKNADYPTFVKKKVLDACFSASLLYNCETWLGADTKRIDVMYMTAIKSFLGVRQTTANQLCLIDAGYPPLKALIQEKQRIFINDMKAKRLNVEDDPLMFAFNLAEESSTPMGKEINRLIQLNGSITQSSIEQMKLNVRNSMRSKFVTYNEINPNLAQNPCISRTDIPAYAFTAASRFRLSSHNLRIETGRWQRLPRDQRLCSCGAIQTEQHAIKDCPRTDILRQQYNLTENDFDMTTFFMTTDMTYVFKVLQVFEV